VNTVARPPQQDRSRRTLAALVDAAEALLSERAFADISIQDICARAGCTTGSFYGRFRSKEDLLPYLYEKYDAALLARIEAEFLAPDWPDITLREAITRFIEGSVEAYAEHLHLMREIMLFARRSPEAISPEIRARRDAVHQKIVGLVAAKAGAAPADAAFALFAVFSAAREMSLFGHTPLARSAPASREALVRRLVRMALAYLAAPEDDP
jgi:AcrR family transcriptional regulator